MCSSDLLVLLIIFMVTSSVMSQLGMDVNLPKASATVTQQTEPEGVVVTLLPDGGLKVNEAKVSSQDFTEFEGRLKTAFTKTSSRLVILEGDRQAFLGQAIAVMDHARRAGADRFAIATQTA